LEKFPAAARRRGSRKNICNNFSASHLQFHGQSFLNSPFFCEPRVKVLNSSVEIRVEMAARRTRSLAIPYVSPVCTIVGQRSQKFSRGDRRSDRPEGIFARETVEQHEYKGGINTSAVEGRA
jgi:hypothetical protein